MNSSSMEAVGIKVSICIITYNHESFIRDALDSILEQEVDFNYEIVIGEDCSTDNTRAALLEYAEQYPDRVRLLLREKNLGMMQNLAQTLSACRGEYVALCEGDDYWTSTYKLQTQVDFLDSHPDYSISSHNVLVKREGSDSTSHEWLGSNSKEILTLEDLLRDGSGGATCSLVFRNRVYGELPDWYHTIHGGDWALQVLCASQGKMRYFREKMGVYRQHDRGALYAATVAALTNGEDTIALPSRNALRVCDTFDQHFAYRYRHLIDRQRAYCYWTGAIEYANAGKMPQARKFLLKALPKLLRLPPWLTLRTLLRQMAVILLPSPAIKSWRTLRASFTGYSNANR